ncbi:hypothetical protein Ccrd_021120 [Cynara cardunculus var. scolymus]|uniref:Myc-type, basic helix-loop-helix (BHLH) domain-containing protein n=1 Tax=Cynara cardunculus var. scolymus TaxID=59895 RepID=A0A103Y171_CYNCS|nr:hypothetical protein Ccrd_021120 [Cynara cardunculus var. scolymus]
MYGDGGSSDAIARDMNSLLHSSTFKHRSEGEFAKIKELISSDSYSNYNDHEHNHNHNHNLSRNQNQNQNHQRHDLGGQNESSLMRYRSAPSSFYANLLDESGCDDFLAPVDTSSNHEPEERFFSSNQQQQQKFRSDSHEFLQYASTSASMKLETKEAGIQKLDLPPVSTAMYGGSSQQAPHFSPCNGDGNYTNHNNLGSSSTFRTMNSTSTNLIRQSSSPAGLLSSLNAETGRRDVDKGNPSSGLNNNHISFSSQPSLSPMYLPQIVENTNEMNDSPYRSLKRTRDGDSKMFHSSITMDTESGASGHYTPSLIHHTSLPKTSSEKAVVEKFLRFQQDSIPCKTRAKRGCATHPRSIAERQTSTADMLDLAVQYIKDLQKDLQTLNNARARCTCSSK